MYWPLIFLQIDQESINLDGLRRAADLAGLGAWVRQIFSRVACQNLALMRSIVSGECVMISVITAFF